ncbi:hypothetical protein J6590_028466 [Homalodisca vitripennis]|nr:hypothetical protein J6590_028466 [Homalodisca vitripennis]
MAWWRQRRSPNCVFPWMTDDIDYNFDCTTTLHPTDSLTGRGLERCGVSPPHSHSDLGLPINSYHGIIWQVSRESIQDLSGKCTVSLKAAVCDPS